MLDSEIQSMHRPTQKCESSDRMWRQTVIRHFKSRDRGMFRDKGAL